jgi:hypothetical protein
VEEWKRRRSLGAMNEDDPPPFFVSVDSTGDEVVCFHTDLKVLILIGVGGGGLSSRFWRNWAPGLGRCKDVALGKGRRLGQL